LPGGYNNQQQGGLHQPGGYNNQQQGGLHQPGGFHQQQYPSGGGRPNYNRPAYPQQPGFIAGGNRQPSISGSQSQSSSSSQNGGIGNFSTKLTKTIRNEYI